MMLAALSIGCVVLVIASVHDLRHRRIPNPITHPAIGLCAVGGVVGLASGLETEVASAAAGGALFGLLLFLPHWLRPGSMGLGDVKLAIPLGFVIGWSQVEPVSAVLAVGWTLALASLIGLVMAGFAAAQRGESVHAGQAVPFGPALSLAGAIAVGVVLL